MIAVKRKKIIEAIILGIFLVTLAGLSNKSVQTLDTEMYSESASNVNILPFMQDGLCDADILEYYKENIADVKALTEGNMTIYYYNLDLNADNRVDKLVILKSPLHSASYGDMLNILIGEENGYKEVLTGTYRLITQLENEPLGEVYILKSESNGFRDIKMISDGKEILLKYENGRYQQEARNLYFFEEGTERVTYQLDYNFYNHFSGTADLIISKARELEYGVVYELKIDSDVMLEEDYEYAHDRFHLGYFYVTSDKIYRLEDEEMATTGTEGQLADVGTIVCAMWENEDNPEEKGWHEYFILEDGRCEFHSYNNLTETGFYESFTWEEGKGLVEYRSGYGAERDAIHLWCVDEEPSITEAENATDSFPNLDCVMLEGEFHDLIEANPIDADMKWEDNGSEARIMFAAEYRDAWLAEIEHAFVILEQYLSKEDYDTLRTSYENWLEYMEGEFEVEQKIYYSGSEYASDKSQLGPGTYYPVVMERAANRTKEYAVELLSLEYAITGDVEFIYGYEKTTKNDFFYTGGTQTVTYNGYIYSLNANEIWQDVYLDVTEIETFENGTLYTLELQQIDVEDEWDEIRWGRRQLGYFYVTDDIIYKRTVRSEEGFTEEETSNCISLIESDEQAFIEQCYVVCSDTAVADVEHENDYHTYIEAIGDVRSFQLYNDYIGGTDAYETIIWQKGKGIVYYQFGEGDMRMHIAFCDDTYYRDAVYEYFMANIPELDSYAEYINRESEGKAHLTVQVFDDENGIPGGKEGGYQVYVGEQWDDHSVNWDRFFVRADMSEVFYYDLVDGEYWSLEEWRVSEHYRVLE